MLSNCATNCVCVINSYNEKSEFAILIKKNTLRYFNESTNREKYEIMKFFLWLVRGG